MTSHRLRINPPRVVQANGINICVQTNGDPSDAPILLVHGAAASLMAWPDSFVETLLAGSRFVVRYDHRDTGQSVSYPPGAPGYGLYDLVEDAVGLLDALELPRAHIVGISMGGGVGQIMALNHPDRVASLTLMATSPGGPDLPPVSREFIDFIGGSREPDWSDEAAVLEHVLSMVRMFAGNSGRIDEVAFRQMLADDIARSTANLQSSQANHFAIDPGEPVRDRLGAIASPTLVIHGDRDPIFQIGHAEALASEIPGARLLALEGVGHLIPWQAGDKVAREILAHTSRASVRVGGQ